MPILRLTLMLSAAIYAVLIVYGGPQASDVAVSRAVAEPAPLINAAPTGALVTEDGRRLVFAREIHTREITASDGIMLISTAPDRPRIAETAPRVPVFEVTARRVNFRAGPSTNDSVLDTLTQGAEVHIMASLDSGWARIRSLDSGVEGYISAQFLTEQN